MHLVWSTKHRQPFILPDIEEELFSYIGGTCKALECPIIKAGGYKDHVHVLCMLSKKIPLMDLLEKVKAKSSKWIKTKGEAYQQFCWQDGYGAFSVNPTQVETVVTYIANQRIHHEKQGFQDEYRGFLKKYKVDVTIQVLNS